ncbi:hypothetical protein SCARD494_10602 [Seiridium cardinale]
MDSLSDDDNV